jgi:hypothetical protein
MGYEKKNRMNQSIKSLGARAVLIVDYVRHLFHSPRPPSKKFDPFRFTLHSQSHSSQLTDSSVVHVVLKFFINSK